jgi:hypothetical protein
VTAEGRSAHGDRSTVRGDRTDSWTAADAAELDVLVHELVRVAFIHRDRCDACQHGQTCDAMRDAIEAVIEWRDARRLRSRAEYLRSGQDLADFARRIGLAA